MIVPSIPTCTLFHIIQPFAADSYLTLHLVQRRAAE
jgi:hypothetical protein